jgi:hypothetical protein
MKTKTKKCIVCGKPLKTIKKKVATKVKKASLDCIEDKNLEAQAEQQRIVNEGINKMYTELSNSATMAKQYAEQLMKINEVYGEFIKKGVEIPTNQIQNFASPIPVGKPATGKPK